MADLDKCYLKSEVVKILHTSSALDPKFKTLPFIDEDGKDTIFEDLASSVSEYSDKTKPLVKVKEEPRPQQTDLDPPLPALLDLGPLGGKPDTTMDRSQTTDVSKEPLKEDSSVNTGGCLSKLFGDVYVVKVESGVDCRIGAKSSLSLAKDEIERYRKETPLRIDGDSLEWWRSHQRFYPLLAHYAKSFLCIPATSVPSERVFSTAGYVITAQRATLNWKHVDQMIFLKKNLITIH